jgi:hypothetical protein
MNLSQVRGILQTFAQRRVTTGCEVIFANQNSPRPDFPFVMIYTRKGTDVGQPTESRADNYGNVHLTIDANVLVQFQGFGPGALDIIEDLSHEFEKPRQREDLQRAGLIYVEEVMPVSDISAVTGTGFEQRAAFDAMFRVAMEFDDNVSVIEHVIGEGTIDSLHVPIDIGA